MFGETVGNWWEMFGSVDGVGEKREWDGEVGWVGRFGSLRYIRGGCEWVGRRVLGRVA